MKLIDNFDLHVNKEIISLRSAAVISYDYILDNKKIKPRQLPNTGEAAVQAVHDTLMPGNTTKNYWSHSNLSVQKYKVK